MKKRLLLLNPPGRRVYLRDYYCSKSSQADYINHPIDLLFFSGSLQEHFELFALDAIAEKLSRESCLTRVRQIRPEIVVGLCGSASWPEDREFYAALQDQLEVRIVLTGDLLIENRAARLARLEAIEAFVHDFTTYDLRDYLNGADPDGLCNLTIRQGSRIRELPLTRRNARPIDIPHPLHTLFLDKPYRYPFVRSRRFATLLTDFGCPYQCSFCIMSTLGWRVRPVRSVLWEMSELIQLGIREFFFLDQTFGIPRSRALEMTEGIRQLAPNLGWVCFTRPDIATDETLLSAMKAAGCHTLIMGLESGNQTLLDSVRKDYKKADVLAGFEACRRSGLRSVATLLLGLPGETEETVAETLAFLKQVAPDFASFNVAVPRLGTPYRRRLLEMGLAGEELEVMDQSGNPVAVPSHSLTREELQAIRRRAIREFYFRPRYLWKRLRRETGGHDLEDFLGEARQALHLVRSYLFP